MNSHLWYDQWDTRFAKHTKSSRKERTGCFIYDVIGGVEIFPLLPQSDNLL